jgi:hypothetical protein
MGQIRCQEGEDIPILEGYVHNEGNVVYTVPTSTGDKVVPIWIRKCGDGKVEMLAGREANGTPYVVSIYAQPDYTNPPVEPLPYWMVKMLTGLDSAYYTLLEATEGLDDWGIYANLIHYKCYDQEHRKLLIEQNIVTQQLWKVMDRLEGCRWRLEGCRLTELLPGLQGWSDQPRH